MSMVFPPASPRSSLTSITNPPTYPLGQRYATISPPPFSKHRPTTLSANSHPPSCRLCFGRGGGQESFGGPLARLLGATPSLVKEARKRNRGAAASGKDGAAKRRCAVPPPPHRSNRPPRGRQSRHFFLLEISSTYCLCGEWGVCWEVKGAERGFVVCVEIFEGGERGGVLGVRHGMVLERAVD